MVDKIDQSVQDLVDAMMANVAATTIQNQVIIAGLKGQDG